MFPDIDPGELYAIADRIAGHADVLRSRATALAAAVARDNWHGIASELLAAQARGVVEDMSACARRLDDAADALRRHAGRVQGVIDFVRHAWDDVEGWGGSVLDGAAHVLFGGGAGGSGLGGAVNDVLAHWAH
jgi:hypothetical protein